MAKKSIETTGKLNFFVDERGLKATVSFTKGEGEKWTLDRLLSLMAEHSITEGFKVEEVRRLFNLIPDKPPPYTFVVAEGLSPVEPKAETVTWQVAPVPDDMKSQAATVIGSAKPPAITVERHTKNKSKKIVKTKPKLPFMKAKEEEQEVVTEEVRTERVYVDPTVERTAYTLAGEKLGTVEEPQKGEAGRTITGELIPARTLADPHFYPGPGVVRRADELFSEYDGFVRIGSNWVDVVPFETHGWEVSFSEDKVTAYLSFDPGDPHAAAPTAEQICEEAVSNGYDEDRLIPRKEITQLVQKAVATREQIVKAPLTASRDSGFDIFVSDDRLRAVLNVNKGTGRGQPLDYRALGRAIKEQKLAGLDFEQIKKDLSEFSRGTQTELTGYVLAEGVAAEPGPERTVECSVRFLPADETADIKKHLATVLPGVVSEESLAAFPVEIVEDLGYVEAEQRLLTVSPPVPGKPGRDVFGQQIASDPAAEPEVKAFENVERKGNVYISTIAGLLQRGWKDGVTYVRVIEHAEPAVSVRISPGRMAAFISLTPTIGTGRKLSWEAVEEAVTESGVSSGVNTELLHQAHERSTEGMAIEDLIFARGKHPTSSGDGEVDILVELATGKDVTLRSDGSADFRNQDRITAVTAGTPLARIHKQALESEDGWTVLGEKLQAENGESVALEAGANVSLREEDGGVQLLVADIDGELIYDENRFEIRAGHTVDGDVDLSSGNVKFPGNVTVKGSVRTGFYVMASGDIQVGELVESALLSADGDIVINQGVKGGGKAVIRTKKSAGMLFAEQATILAVGNVQVRNSLIHCTVKTNGKLRMIGDRCRILGGEFRCRGGLETQDLGSERGVRTVVHFGQNYLIADQIEREEKEMARVKQEVANIDFAMKEKERENNKAELNALHAKKLAMLKTLEKRGLRVFTLRERFEEHQESSVVVTGTLYPGVVFESHGRTLEIPSEKKGVTVSFSPESGRIEIRETASESE